MDPVLRNCFFQKGMMYMHQNKEQYIIIKGKAGLGNRILVILDSLIYSDLSGRTPIIDWSDGSYAPYGINAFPLLFTAPSDKNIQLSAFTDSVFPETWNGNLQYSVDRLFAKLYPHDVEIDTVGKVARLYTIDTRKISYSEKVVVRWGWTQELYKLRRFFHGPHEKLKYMTDNKILGSVIRERLCPVDEIQLCVKAFRDKFFNDAVIGLHIRHSDRKNSYDGYFKYVDNFLRVYPSGVVFVATDNSDVEFRFKSRYPNTVASEKWYPPPGMPIHRNRHPDRDLLRNAREALIELYLLGTCNALVYDSTSTFGYLASLLSDAPNENIFDMAPWSIRRYMKRMFNLISA